MPKISSMSLSLIPFVSNTDSTRLQMASKQIQQSLSSPNTEIPYVISSNYIDLVKSSPHGIKIAPDSGQVVFKDKGIMVVFYENLNRIETFSIPKVKRVFSHYGSVLRFALDENIHFNKGDVLWYYDAFRNGIPAVGYNVNVMYSVLAGYNHEDALLISESFAERAVTVYTEKLFIPVFPNSIFKPIYRDPETGQMRRFPLPKYRVLPNGVVLEQTQISDEMRHLVTISMLLNFISDTPFNQVKTTIPEDDAVIASIKVHLMKKRDKIKMLDQETLKELIQLNKIYGKHIVESYDDLRAKMGEKYAKYILEKYMICKNRKVKYKGKYNFTDAIFIIELDIASVKKSKPGDKFANRYAGKGVVSLIIPDELRPVTASGKKIDYIISPFTVFSRMNLGQVLETMVAKAVQQVDENIKNGANLVDELKRLDPILKILHGESGDYYVKYQNLLTELEQDKERQNEFMQLVASSNLFIEAKPFHMIDVYKLNQIINQQFAPIQEPVFIKKELVQYIKDKLHVQTFPVRDLWINSLTGPQYILKLSKIADDILWARDLGRIKTVTGQPHRGKSKEGGIRLGYMEQDGLLAHGTIRALQELRTVKADYVGMKRDLIKQYVRNGEYDMDKFDYTQNTDENKALTFSAVDKIIDFLRY